MKTDNLLNRMNRGLTRQKNSGRTMPIITIINYQHNDIIIDMKTSNIEDVENALKKLYPHNTFEIKWNLTNIGKGTQVYDITETIELMSTDILTIIYHFDRTN